MPLPLTHIQDELSMAYVKAIAAGAGAAFVPVGNRDYGIDCDIKPVKNLPNGSYSSTGYYLQCQVKSTTDWIEKDEFLIYDMKVDAYNKLAQFEYKTAILVLLKLPKKQSEWLKCSEDCMELRNCCYWTIISDPPTQNRSTTRINVLKTQVFDCDAVIRLLDLLRLNRGSLL